MKRTADTSNLLVEIERLIAIIAAKDEIIAAKDIKIEQQRIRILELERQQYGRLTPTPRDDLRLSWRVKSKVSDS